MLKAVKSLTGQAFLLTINQTERWDEVKEYLYSLSNRRYIVAALELAPSTGHKHIHCYIQFTKPSRLSMKKMLGIDVRRVTNHSAKVVEYVKKDNNIIVEEGSFAPRGGYRGLTIKEAAELTFEEELEQDIKDVKLIQYARQHVAQRQAAENKHFEPVLVHWLYGPTGTGKSRRAFEAGAYRLTYRDGFFNDWGDARILWLDDYRGEIPYNLFLQLLDGYRNSLIVNIKGGHKVVDYDEMYITSPLSPSDCYPRQAEKQDSIKQLLRRITEVVWTGGAHVLDARADLNNPEKICDENQFY
nr:MAG: rep protein [Cressdnaviricota sp.]